MRFLTQWAIESWAMVVESAPWLLAGFLLAGFIYVAIPVTLVSRHLGQPGLLGVLKAAIVGIPLPLCSCSVIPIASSLRKQGASKSATAGFLISTPETGVDSIAITYSLLGPFMAIARPLAAFATTIVAGGLIAVLDRNDRPADQTSKQVDSCSTGHCCDDSGPAERGGFIDAVRYGWVTMFADLAFWLVIGFVIGGFFAAILPEGYLERTLGAGLLPMMIMLIVGLPSYVCATSSTPVAAALVAGGLSPGAALVFLLAGPATNMATMLIVLRDLGWRSLVIYLLSIASVAVAAGIILDRIVAGAGGAIVPPLEAENAGFFSIACALVLTGLLINGMLRRTRGGESTPGHVGVDAL